LFAQDASTNAVAAPAISEEAHKHFVMGTALFKDAKTADDYTQVIGEFKQATDLAPQWPDARYNLAAVKEAAGDLSGAMADLKVYQQFKLSDTEARTAQDKIYVLEAKIQKIATAKAEEQRAAAAAAKARELPQALEGDWYMLTWAYDEDKGKAYGTAHYRLKVEGNFLNAYLVFDKPYELNNGYTIRNYVAGDAIQDVKFTWLGQRSFSAEREYKSGSSKWSGVVTEDEQTLLITHVVYDSHYNGGKEERNITLVRKNLVTGFYDHLPSW
jgi:hypothetical protein